MIDKPVSPAGNAPVTFSPLVRAVIDSVSEGVVIFDQQGRVLYANAPARRVIDGQNGGGGGPRGGRGCLYSAPPARCPPPDPPPRAGAGGERGGGGGGRRRPQPTAD